MIVDEAGLGKGGGGDGPFIPHTQRVMPCSSVSSSWGSTVPAEVEECLEVADSTS